MALFTCVIVHPNIIHNEHFSSCYCALKILFIVALSLKIPINFTNILTIHIGIVHYLYMCPFLPIFEVYPKLDAKCGMKHYHVVE